jgi:transposase
MIQLKFSKQDINELEYERYNHPHPRVQQKMWVLYLKHFGKIPHELITEITGVSPNTMRAYFNEYRTGGIESLKRINFYQPKSKLIEHKATIEQYFRDHPPATVAEAASKIEELTGIKRGLTQTAKFMKNIGMKFRKVGSIPAQSNNEIKKKNK